MREEEFMDVSDWGKARFVMEYPNFTLEVKHEGDLTLTNMLETFEAFLRAAGYSFKGRVVIDVGAEEGFYDSENV